LLALFSCTYAQSIETGLAGVLTVLAIFFFNFKGKWLAFLAQISYSLYLLHNSTGSILISLTRNRTDALWIELAVAVLAMLLAVMAAYLLFVLVERPSQKLSGKISYKAAGIRSIKNA
jgi:peptidoglycan/LPS O-acetylase OafA/YrhL